MAETSKEKLDHMREAAKSNLKYFAHLMQPHRVYGQIHDDVFDWWQKLEEDGEDHSGLLLPRDHQKSHMAAVKCAWFIAREPTTTILYVSATAELAIKQLRAVKAILLHPRFVKLWPEMILPEEGTREKWTQTEICVDHPDRTKEGIRDSTVLACGITKTITGLHVNHVFLDDLVVPSNAFTVEGREKVNNLYSQLASIETTGSTETVVGTRYHPSDIYKTMMGMKLPIFDENDEIIGHKPLYNFKVEVVEVNGKYLWPKEQRSDGKTFGFDIREIAKKKEKYIDKTQFYAQYYQEPNDPDSHRLDASKFIYYDPKFLKFDNGHWNFKGKRLNVYAGIDFAFSLNKKSDYSVIVVVGIDSKGFIYVLDIDQFKTDKMDTYFKHVVDMHAKWVFKKFRAEVTVAQKIIVNDLKDRIRAEGSSIVIDEHRPSRHDGSKEERIASVLEPRYENGTMLHQRGGYTPVLEEQLLLARPPHDDIKDCLASVIEIVKAPRDSMNDNQINNVVKFHKRFGGRI